jgi:hypothetical protein
MLGAYDGSSKLRTYHGTAHRPVAKKGDLQTADFWWRGGEHQSSDCRATFFVPEQSGPSLKNVSDLPATDTPLCVWFLTP